jgi:hypothetical protein
MTRDGEDPSIMDLDPEKSVAGQLNNKEEELVDKGPPLKDDPKYVKFFKMLKMVSAMLFYNAYNVPTLSYICLYLLINTGTARGCCQKCFDP